MNRIHKSIAAIAVASTVALSTAGCTIISTHPAERAVHVTGGFIIPADQKVDSCVNPSKVDTAPLGHDYFVYPAGERTYKFSTDQGADGGAAATAA